MNKHDKKAAQIVQNAFATGRVLEVRRNGHHEPQVSALGAAARESVKPVQQVGREASAALAEEAQTRIAGHQDAILRMLLTARADKGDIPTADPKELDAAGTLQCFHELDGSVRFDLLGKPLIQFWPPVAAFAEDGMNVQLPYRVAL